jgi:poly-D-alanine transfer protein DltD
MEELKVELVKGEMDYDLDDEKCHVIMGGDPSNPSWEQYLGQWKEEFQPYIKLIRDCIKEHPCYKGTAGKYANDYYFKFNDGHEFGFSWRAWGDLMQAIVDENEGYMAYYM